MENVAFDLMKKYPPVEPEDFASGWLRNQQFVDYCVEDGGNRCVSLYVVTFGYGLIKLSINEPIRKIISPQMPLALCCRLVAKKCKGNGAGGQGFRLTWRKDVRYRSASGSCWDVSEGGQKAKVTRFACHGGGGNQYWKYALVRPSYGNIKTPFIVDLKFSITRLQLQV